MARTMPDRGSLPLNQEAGSPRPGEWPPDQGPAPEGAGVFPGDSGRGLGRALRELVRYFRHSSVGRRTTGLVHLMNTPLQVLSFQLELLEQKAQEELEQLPVVAAPAGPLLETWCRRRLEKFSQCRQELEQLQSLARRIYLQGVHEEAQEQVYLDLNQVYREELELYQANAFFKHQVVKKLCLKEGLPPIRGHYIDFSQSFRNLVDNALEAMAGEGRRELTVETLLQEGWRILRLGDTGAGIPPEILPRLFEPFFTTKGTPESPHRGLGLFMARRLLAPYGGRLRVESRPGETWVTVRLPVRPEP